MLIDIFNLVINTFKSIKAIGSLRNSTDPVLSFIDGISKYNDFVVLKHKPLADDMSANIIYFYGVNDRVFYISKDMDYNTPTEVIRKDFGKFKDFKGELVFDKILAKINGTSDELGIFSKGAIYRFLISKGKFAAGFKYAFHSKIAVPYRKLEKTFALNHKRLYKAYLAIKNNFHNLCIFAVSETGARTLGLTIAVGLAISTGGIFFAVAAGAYAAGMTISILKQATNKLELNRLKEESELLEKYALAYRNKIMLSLHKNIAFKDNFPKDQLPEKPPVTGVKKWSIAAFKYITTFGLELAVPVAASFLSPVSAVMQFSIMLGSAVVSCGIGVYFKKLENDKKQILIDALKDAKTYPFIPDYKNITELREFVRMQDNQVASLKLVESGLSRPDAVKQLEKEMSKMDTSVAPKFFFKEYGKALFEVVNPFDRTKEIKDSREVSTAVKSLEDAVKMNMLFDTMQFKEKEFSNINKNDFPGLSQIKTGGNYKGISVKGDLHGIARQQ